MIATLRGKFHSPYHGNFSLYQFAFSTLGKSGWLWRKNCLRTNAQYRSHSQLSATLTKLDRFDLLIIDDLGYVKKSEAETGVLFELIAHRYECRSLLVTANQPFSQWDAIFSDSTMTVAAVDRLVHHALIIDIQGESFRKQSALERAQSK